MIKNNILIIALIFVLTSCAASRQELSKFDPQSEAIIIAPVDITMDGERDIDSKTLQCFPGFETLDTQGQKIKSRSRIEPKDSIAVIKTTADDVNLRLIYCMDYKVLYNKTRQAKLENVKMTPKKGFINYPGSLIVDWDASSFNVGDILVSGGGGMVATKQKNLSIKLENNIEEVKQFIATNYPDLSNMPIIYNPYHDSEEIIK